MAEPKFVFLGAKNLKICWDWAEANDKHPLGRAYINSCIGLNVESHEIVSALGGDWKDVKVTRKLRRRVESVRDHGFRYRDSIGRLILDYIAAKEKYASAQEKAPGAGATPC